MINLYGMRVVVNNNIKSGPKLQLSEKFAAMMPTDWVEEQNKWLRNFFGEYADCFIVGGNMLVVSPEKYARLRVQLNAKP